MKHHIARSIILFALIATLCSCAAPVKNKEPFIGLAGSERTLLVDCVLHEDFVEKDYFKSVKYELKKLSDNRLVLPGRHPVAAGATVKIISVKRYLLHEGGWQVFARGEIKDPRGDGTAEFVFRWDSYAGAGLRRAPWEPASVPDKRPY